MTSAIMNYEPTTLNKYVHMNLKATSYQLLSNVATGTYRLTEARGLARMSTKADKYQSVVRSYQGCLQLQISSFGLKFVCRYHCKDQSDYTAVGKILKQLKTTNEATNKYYHKL